MATNTSNMNLIVPTIGTDSGLVWEQSVNANTTVIDQHDHTSGSGVQIPPSGLNINTALPFNNQQATGLQAIQFTPQASLATAGAVYVIGSDLYYNNGGGTPIKITTGTSVNATTSGISSGTASAAFVASVLVVNADTNKPANIQAGSILIGNNITSSKFLTLAPPNAMAADYGLTLPALPAAQSFLTLDASGAFATPILYSGGITSTNLAASSVGTTQIAAGAVTLTKIASGIIPSLQSQTFTSNGTFTVPTGISQISVIAYGGGGGGGGGAYNLGGSNTSNAGGGGAGGGVTQQSIAVTPGESLSVVVGAGGNGGAGSNSVALNGSSGGTSLVLRSGTTIVLAGAGGGGVGGTTVGGAFGAGGTGFNATDMFSTYRAAGGNGGSGAAGSPGNPSLYFPSSGAAGGTSTSSNAGGGGGGSGYGIGGAGGAGTSGGGFVGASAAANSGAGGGGGGCGTAPSKAGGNGGSGIVIISWVGP